MHVITIRRGERERTLLGYRGETSPYDTIWVFWPWHGPCKIYCTQVYCTQIQSISITSIAYRLLQKRYTLCITVKNLDHDFNHIYADYKSLTASLRFLSKFNIFKESSHDTHLVKRYLLCNHCLYLQAVFDPAIKMFCNIFANVLAQNIFETF